jgi:hypothetical protein
MTAAHAVTMNGRVSTELKSRPGRSVQEELNARLALLDGKERFALWLWRLPAGVPFDRVDLETGPTEFIQCAGGVAERFTCEVRRVDPDGNPQHEVIGRREPGEASAVRSENIRWADRTASVRRNEVLDRDEVSELFRAYLASGEIPAAYETRPLVP